MTARNQARIAERRLGGQRGGRAFEPEPTPSLGELLLAARERKGVDLATAEADTRIRARFLDALERGEFEELPGHVYTKGFLRNYATYLGLDPDAMVVRWKEEIGAVHPSHEQVVIRPRRPSVPHRPAVFGRGSYAVGIAALLVLVFAGYVGLQLVRAVGSTPLTVDQPSIVELDAGATTFTLSGAAAPGATVAITAGDGTVMRLSAGEDGSWSRELPLATGRNDFSVLATDPGSGKASQPVRLIVQVAAGQGPEAPTLTVTSPNDGTEFANGAIPIQGKTNAARVTVTAEIGAASPRAPRPSPEPEVPAAKEIAVRSDGAFSDSYQLAPGTWVLTITATGDQNKTTTETRTVTVSFTGVNVVVHVREGRSWIRAWVDGELSPDAPGFVVGPGGSLEFTGADTVEVRTGSSGVTHFTVNGTSLGTLGPTGIAETWLFDPPNEPRKTGRTN